MNKSSDSPDTKSADEALRTQTKKRKKQQQPSTEEPKKRRSTKKRIVAPYDVVFIQKLVNEAMIMLGCNNRRAHSVVAAKTSTPYNDLSSIEYAEAIILRLCNPYQRLEPKTLLFKEALQIVSNNQWKPEVQHVLRHHLGQYQNTMSNVFFLNRHLKEEVYNAADNELAFIDETVYEKICQLNDVSFGLYMTETRALLINSINQHNVTPSTLVNSSSNTAGSAAATASLRRFRLHNV